MVVVYYLDAELFLVDKSVLELTPAAGGLFSFGSLALAWLALRRRLPVGARAIPELRFAIGGYLFLVVMTYAFTHVLSGRGAVNQIGAIVGTIMVANVFALINSRPEEDRRKHFWPGQSPDPK